jgi:hypothetical protein
VDWPKNPNQSLSILALLALTLIRLFYFEGRFNFALGILHRQRFHRAFSTKACLRESTGSIWAGAVTPATLDVLVIVPGLVAGP